MLAAKCSANAFLPHLRWAMAPFKAKTCRPRVSLSRWSKEVFQDYASLLKSPQLYCLSQWLVWLVSSANRTTTTLHRQAKLKVFLNPKAIILVNKASQMITKQWSKRGTRSTSATGMALLKPGMKRAGQALGTMMTIWPDPLWPALTRLKTRGLKSQVFMSRSKGN